MVIAVRRIITIRVVIVRFWVGPEVSGLECEGLEFLEKGARGLELQGSELTLILWNALL